jgi:hypothetical protein
MLSRLFQNLPVATVAAAILLLTQAAAAQNQPAPPPPPVAAPNPQQLDDLVAPIALYPDPLLGEVLAASTYPMEISEADQWMHQHQNWKPAKLMDEAKKQNWDPSVQGLVAFPQALDFLSENVSWTTQLGNAFLANQSEVMQAVQRMRAQAQQRGTLRTTPQDAVNEQNQNGQTVINIEPANPDVWYVPDYNPVYVWGPPVWGYYPPLVYPGIGIGFRLGTRNRSGSVFRRLGRLGMGRLGLDSQLVRRRHFHQSLLL